MLKIFKVVLKVIISVGMLALMLYLAGIDSVIETIASANYTYIFIGCVSIFLGTIVTGYRWYIVMKILEFKGSLSFYLKSYMKGMFFSQILPSSIGGDAVRILDVAGLGYKKRYAFVGVLIDRGLGIFGIALLNIVFINISHSILPDSLFLMLNLLCVVIIAGFFAFALIHKLKFIEKLKYASVLLLPSSYLLKSMYSPIKFAWQVILSMVSHIFTFIGVYFIAYSLGATISIATLMVLMPPVILLTIIPVSLAGWGIREGAMVGFLGFAGISSSMAVSISILFGFSYIVQGIVGLYYWFTSNKIKDIEHEC